MLRRQIALAILAATLVTGGAAYAESNVSGMDLAASSSRALQNDWLAYGNMPYAISSVPGHSYAKSEQRTREIRRSTKIKSYR